MSGRPRRSSTRKCVGTNSNNVKKTEGNNNNNKVSVKREPSSASNIGRMVSPDCVKSSGPVRKKQRRSGTPIAIPSPAISNKAMVPNTAKAGTRMITPPSSSSALKQSTKQQQQPAKQPQRPTPEECAFAVAALGTLHPSVLEQTREIRSRTAPQPQSKSMATTATVKPDPATSSSSSASSKTFSANSCGVQPSILDGVVATMLSQNTTAANSTKAFANLKKVYPEWKEIAALTTVPLDDSKLIDAIRVAGLARRRSHNIWTLCKTLVEERGEASLEYLRQTPHTNAQIKAELLRFPGLGVKTVSCVLMFTMGRLDEFPVDTHVHRISKQNGWIPPSYSRDEAYAYLNTIIPNEYKMDLHCLLIQHGRECHRCAARGKPQFPPKDGSKLDCPMVHLNAIAASGQYSTIPKEFGDVVIKKEDVVAVKVEEDSVTPDGVVSSME